MSSDNANNRQIERSEELKAEGFEAGELVYEFSTEFSKNDLKDAFFESKYYQPRPLLVDLINARINQPAQLQVVITMVRAVYSDEIYQRPDGTMGYYNDPAWYLEGWLVKAGFEPDGEVVRVRAVIDTDEGGALEGGRIQRIPASPDPDGLVRIAW